MVHITHKVKPDIYFCVVVRSNIYSEASVVTLSLSYKAEINESKCKETYGAQVTISAKLL